MGLKPKEEKVDKAKNIPTIIRSLKRPAALRGFHRSFVTMELLTSV